MNVNSLSRFATAPSQREPRVQLLSCELFLDLADVLLALHSGDSAVCAGGDDLTERSDANVAGGVNAGDVGLHLLVGVDITGLFLHVKDAFKHTGGLSSGEAEQAEETVIDELIDEAEEAEKTVVDTLIGEAVEKKEKAKVIGHGGTIGVDMEKFSVEKKREWNEKIRSQYGIDRSGYNRKD